MKTKAFFTAILFAVTLSASAQVWTQCDLS